MNDWPIWAMILIVTGLFALVLDGIVGKIPDKTIDKMMRNKEK